MFDDIVNRLRADRDVDLFPILEEAADEIDFLRNKLEKLRNVLNTYNETCECDGCAACCQFELLVRDEQLSAK